MKRFFTILLTAVMILSAFAATIVGVAATDTPDEELYLSDITPTGWKIIDGSTPGYNVYFEDGTPLVLGGVTYEKGLSTHPGSTFDAEFVYDISDYDYTTFSAIVGKTDRYVTALPGSFTSFYVYVDGVLADQVINLVAGKTYTFSINVAGASELKLVTGAGSDNITCDGSIWANAKLSYDKIDPVDPEDPPAEPGEELYLSDTTPKSAIALSGPFYDKNEQGEPLLLDGTTYEKGIWTHPMPSQEAECVYDISGYDYTTFYAIVGKEQKYVNALPGSLLTVRVYVDGVVADEVVDLVAGETYTFKIDITDASELKLVTGCGSDNITCDGSVWAFARLSYDSLDPEDPPVDPEDPPVDPPVDPEDPPVDPPVDPGKQLYLSDTAPKRATSLAGPCYDKNEQGEPLLLGGFTYEKGLWTHPMSGRDAEFVYDISKYDYTVFYAIVGKEQKYVNALPGSLLTFRVYVDGVLADEVVDLVAGETYVFKVDIEGASELKLVTGCGSDNITCDGSIWANAKLTTGEDGCEQHVWDNGRVIKEPTCSEVGQMQYQCTSCIGDKIEDIPVVPHTPGTWIVGEQATCTEAGTKVQKCTECGEVVNTEAWEAKGHIPGVWATTQSPTCTEVGKKAQTCQSCGEVLAEEEISATGHFFGDWGMIDGQKVRVCECGEQEIGSGCSALLSVGAIAMMLLAVGTTTLLSSKKRR